MLIYNAAPVARSAAAYLRTRVLPERTKHKTDITPLIRIVKSTIIVSLFWGGGSRCWARRVVRFAPLPLMCIYTLVRITTHIIHTCLNARHLWFIIHHSPNRRDDTHTHARDY